MRKQLLLILFIGILFLAACGTPHQLPEAPTPIPRLDPATLPPPELEAAPAAEGEAEEVPSEDVVSGDPAAGEAVFSTCSICHRLDDQQGVGPGLAELFDRTSLPNGEFFSEAALRQWIRTGGGAMPGQALGDADLNDLIAYLREATQ